MSKMSLKEALAAVLKDMDSLSPEELKADLQKHRNGSFALALRQAREFLALRVKSRSFHIVTSRFVQSVQDEGDFELVKRSVLMFECETTAHNDNSYALAA